MSNQGGVTTSKRILTKKSVTKILNKLNKTIFKNILKIEYASGRGNKSYWGKDMWFISWINGYNSEEQKVCWLKTARCFEMNHGDGSYFASWLGRCITNEIAVAHDGIIFDDGCAEKWKGIKNKYPTFLDFMKYITRYGSYESFKQFTTMENECVPNPLKALDEDIAKGNELQIKN